MEKINGRIWWWLINGEDYQTICFERKSIDKIIKSLEINWVFSVLFKIIQELLKNSDWRYQHAAIIVIFQIFEVHLRWSLAHLCNLTNKWWGKLLFWHSENSILIAKTCCIGTIALVAKMC
jgi:hypothetical protein